MASSSFRDSMNSLGWSRRDPGIPATTNTSTPILGKLQSLNPFGQGGNVRLPLFENESPGAPLPARTRREEEEGWFACTYPILSSFHPSRPPIHARGVRVVRGLAYARRCTTSPTILTIEPVAQLVVRAVIRVGRLSMTGPSMHDAYKPVQY